MNLRFHKSDDSIISKLADQAHEATFARYQERMKKEHPSDIIFYDMFNKELARLIVKECTYVVADAVDHREPASTYVSKIKEHFGVEE